MAARPPVTPPVPGSTLGLLEAALAAHAARLRALAVRARAGGDADLVHDVRVVLRRVEAVARLFRGSPREADGEELRKAARRLRRRLSSARSDEVGRSLLAARLGEGGEELLRTVFPEEPPGARVGAGELSGVLRRLAAWRRKTASTAAGPFAPRAGLDAELHARVRRRLLRRVRRLATLLPPGRRTLHAARIAAKRVRYALEVLEPADPALRPALRLLRAFQEAAGDAHDLVELAGLLRAAGPTLEGTLAGIEADAAGAAAAARRRGAALERPVRRLLAALGRHDSR